jgi:hypothetical protein|eukprot:COSAG01_NODE_1863_length_9037_cov_37.811591_10_plen_94_part_00
MFASVDQAKMELAMQKMTERRRASVGRSGLSSFADLGYRRCGLDDAWQKVGTACTTGSLTTLVPAVMTMQRPGPAVWGRRQRLVPRRQRQPHC